MWGIEVTWSVSRSVGATPVTRVTIADVATAAGVSKTAVSFAFNNPERLGLATLERVLQVASDLGYTPHPAARALSMRRSGTMGLLIPQRLTTVFANPFLSELIQGLGELKKGLANTVV